MDFYTQLGFTLNPLFTFEDHIMTEKNTNKIETKKNAVKLLYHQY